MRGNGGQDRVGAPSLSFSLFAAPPIPPRWQKELARSSGKRHNWLGIEPRSTYFCRLRRSRPVAEVNRELQGCVNLNSCCLCPHNQLLCPTSLSTFTHSAKKCGSFHKLCNAEVKILAINSPVSTREQIQSVITHSLLLLTFCMYPSLTS